MECSLCFVFCLHSGVIQPDLCSLLFVHTNMRIIYSNIDVSISLLQVVVFLLTYMLFAGTVYLPHEPLFFQSLWNPFIFRCADGVMIDGNHRGLSKWIYKYVGDKGAFTSSKRL